MTHAPRDLPLDLMTCGKENHYWRGNVYRDSDCPICKLTVENAMLKEALTEIANHTYDKQDLSRAREIARAALTSQQEPASTLPTSTTGEPT